MTDGNGTAVAKAVKAAFGAVNRERLIREYFAGAGELSAANAWRHVYRLLLWTDQTTGLAHCYESDKSQPGKHWYARSLAFHDWLSSNLSVQPDEIADATDWLFRHASAELAEAVLRRSSRVLKAAEAQRRPYEGRGFPKPGEEPELAAIIEERLRPYLRPDTPPHEEWHRLTVRIRQYYGLENKRRNLVGEGFEDVIAAIIRRTTPDRNEVQTRQLLHNLPGFNRSRRGDKPNKVDIAIVNQRSAQRTLVTAKWSLRADREKQFSSEYAEYIAAESNRRSFNYVFVTNEFDPARLMRACEALSGNAPMFSHVVHINPGALIATYGSSPDNSMERVVTYIVNGRLIGLGEWLALLGDDS